MKAEYIVVLITASGQEEAGKITDLLLSKKQAACVNDVPGIISKYRWQGKIETSEECLLIVKTTTAALEEVIRLVKSAHSYNVPEIIALPIIAGNGDYLDWIGKEVQGG